MDQELIYIVNYHEGVLLQDIWVDFQNNSHLDNAKGRRNGHYFTPQIEKIFNDYINGKNTSKEIYSELVVRKDENGIDYNFLIKESTHNMLDRRKIANEIMNDAGVLLALDTLGIIYFPIRLDKRLFYENEGRSFLFGI